MEREIAVKTTDTKVQLIMIVLKSEIYKLQKYSLSLDGRGLG